MSIPPHLYRHKGGVTPLISEYVAKSRELIIDTAKQEIRIGDGVTPGGIKQYVDPQNQEFKIDRVHNGWRDLVSDVTVRGNGLNNPAWTQFRNGISAYAFEPDKMMECWSTFHIDHDYAMGTSVYPHIHWTVNNPTATGVVRWGIEYTVAKGHRQGAGSIFGATSVVYIETSITGADQYQHIVSEVNQAQAISSYQLEPDSIVMIRAFRDGTHVNDTYTGNVFGICVDIHYQLGQIATLNKSPNFWG